MKAVLEFDLTEEESTFQSALNGWKWKMVVWTILEQHLRNKLKHGHKYKDADEALEDMKKFIYEELEENNLTLD